MIYTNMAAKQILFAIFVMAAFFAQGTRGQKLADDACMKAEFFNEALTCFYAKFNWVANLTSSSRSSSSAAYESQFGGRTLMSMKEQLKWEPGNKSQGNKIHMLYRSANVLHESVMQKMFGGEMFQLNKEQRKMVEQLKQVDFQGLLQEFLNSVTNGFSGLNEIAAIHRALRAETGESINIDASQLYTLMSGEPRNGTGGGETPIVDVIDRLGEVLTCLNGVPEEELEDGFTWLKCLYTCDDLPNIANCMDEKYINKKCGNKTHTIKEIAVRGFQSFLGLDDCIIKIIEPSNVTDPIELVEGEGPVMVRMQQYLPPEYHCIDLDALGRTPLDAGITLVLRMFQIIEYCKVEYRMSLSNYVSELLPYNIDLGDLVGLQPGAIHFAINRPKCRSNPDKSVTQAVIGDIPNGGSNASCIINVTRDNWNETFNIPLVAAVDMKEDGDITTSFTIKYVVNGTVEKNFKMKTIIRDRDFNYSSACRSVNDPHIHTFDGFYYNNFYEGYFYLYRNKKLPYEVQVIYQRCSPGDNATCTCAVAVRSGDDVFVVDKCRLKPGKCALGSDEDCQNIARVIMYTHGDVTPGTRVFKKDGGLKYEVLTPHGTWIKIVQSDGLLNVHVFPSSYDREQSEGLCGSYDGYASNDLTMPNGTVYTGVGSGSREQPRPFSNAWRVPDDKRIFYGAENSDYMSGNYCTCHLTLFAGLQCQCGHDKLVETCDIDTDGEITSEIFNIIVKSHKQDNVVYLEGALSATEDFVDVNDTYEPPNINFTTPSREVAEACKRHLGLIPGIPFLGDMPDRDTFLGECRVRYENSPQSADKFMWGCYEDYQLVNNLTYVASAVAAMSERCMEEMLLDPTVTQSYYNGMKALSCINNCSSRGSCVNGTCRCEGGWTGADCGMRTDLTPEMKMPSSIMCDTRREPCNKTVVLGHNFVDSGELKCYVEELQVSSTSAPSGKGGHQHVSVTLITYTQLACQLPKSSSYRVQLSWKTQVQQATLQMVTYDSACYTCDSNQLTCTRNTDEKHCMIGGGCYADTQQDPGHHCKHCNISLNTEQFVFKPDDYCQQVMRDEQKARDDDQYMTTIRVSVSVSLCVIIIIVAIVLYCCVGRKAQELSINSGDSEMPKENPYENMDGGPGVTNKHGTHNAAYVSAPEDADKVTNDNCEARNPQLQAVQNDMRSRSGSTGSVGIGGGGPTHLSRFQRGSTSDDHAAEESLGLGAHMSKGSTRSTHKHLTVAVP